MTIESEYLSIVDLSDVVVVILGGGRGTRLYPLTRDRAKPAVGFGGKYRLIDITLTNCLRSGLERVFILTQFNSFSLNRHIWQAYSRELQRTGFVDVIAAEQRRDNADWYQGTADAVRQSLRYILHHNPKYVLILSADQIYSMDYRELLLWHQTRHADVTIAGHYTSESRVLGLGVIKVNRGFQVVDFYEKPRALDQVKDFRLDSVGITNRPAGKWFLTSMGIYLFNTPVLVEALSGKEEDFGKAIIPQTAGRCFMSCYPFDGYWEDVGTIGAFYKANMDWCMGRGIASAFETGRPIITHSRQLPPSRIEGTTISESIIADGCHIRAKSIARSIIGVRTRIGRSTVIEDSILMGNDSLEWSDSFEIGDNVFIRGAIIDKNVVIGDNVHIDNRGEELEADHDLYSIRSGIVIVPRAAVIPADSRFGEAEALEGALASQPTTV